MPQRLRYHWGRFYFTDENIRTDFLLYRDRSYLALPSEGEENRFLIQSSDTNIDFYVGSTSMENYTTIQKFFEKLYSCYIKDEIPSPLNANGSVTLRNSKQSRRHGFRYFPGFIKNVIYLPSSVPDLTLQYEVIIRSRESRLTGRKRFNFCTSVRTEYHGGSIRSVSDYIKGEVARLRKDRNWRMKVSRSGRARFRADIFSDPLLLSNFVRVPEDEGQI